MASKDEATMQQIALAGMQKLLKACPRKSKELKDECTAAVESLAALDGEARNADKYVFPLKLACDTLQPKCIIIALDCLQKLIAGGFIRGEEFVDNRTYPVAADAPHHSSEGQPPPPATVPPQQQTDEQFFAANGQRRRLMDVIIQTVFDVAAVANDDVQQLVIKVLLTCVTSSTTRVHDQSLLLAVRTCYQVHLNSRNKSNQTFAKATLTQMFTVVFHKMEYYARQLAGLENKEVLNRARVAETKELLANSQWTPPVTNSPTVHSTSDPTSPIDNTGEEATMSMSDFVSSATPASIRTKAFLEKELTDCDLFQRKLELKKAEIAPKFALVQNDAYLLFRSLCKLSSKSLPDPPDELSLRSKSISLELILNMFGNGGNTFRTAPAFRSLIKDELVLLLLKNCVSAEESIFSLSAAIFLSLISNFKAHLKHEMGVFLDTIFLRIIKSDNSSYSQKMVSLQVIQKICQDAQTIVDIFLNYDCDLENCNVFQQITTQLEKLSQGKFIKQSWMTVEEESQLRLVALQCMTNVLESLLVWSEKKKIRAENSKEDEIVYDDDHDESVHAEKTNGVVSSKFMQNLNSQRELKKKLDTGILKFNRSSKKGLNYLFEGGLLDKEDPSAIANFFLQHQDVLDKVTVGEYLGNQIKFNGKVLHEYVSRMQFHGLAFDEGIRHFLQGFRLPGEAQQIDRLMEKFAEQYCNHNPGIFNSADTAYVLAYSIIMLNTDAHNPTIKHRMTKEQFLKNNRGIDDGQDVDEEFMCEIYNNIIHNEIKLKGEGPTDAAELLGVKKGARIESFKREGQDMVQRTHEMILSKARASTSIRPSPSTPSIPLARSQSSGRDSTSQLVTLAIELGKESEGLCVSINVRDDSSNSLQRHGSTESLTSLTKNDSFNDLPEHEEEKSAIDNAVFYQAHENDFEAVIPMFEIVWCPTFAALSVLLEVSDNPTVIALCLEGYAHAIRIACFNKLDTARLAFMNSLKNFTLLESARGVTKQLQQKNIDAIKLMLDLAYTDGDYLKESWGDVLLCISAFDRLQLISVAAKTKEDVFKTSELVSSSHPDYKGSKTVKETPSPGKKRQSLFSKANNTPVSLAQASTTVNDELNSKQITEKLSSTLIDRIFTRSSSLSGEAVIDFVDQLRIVSELELANIEHPRVFCLSKIVEITEYNMTRIRIVWTRIWGILSTYFMKAGCHPNLQVSMFAIDSLRQLAVKFLEKDELANYQFQKQFLQPFEYIIQRNKSTETNVLVIHCLLRLIMAEVNNVKSGWKSVFICFATAAGNPNQDLVTTSFTGYKQMLRDYFPIIITNEALDECIKGLIAFVCNVFTPISIDALQYLLFIANYLTKVDAETLKGSDASPESSSVAEITALEPRKLNARTSSSNNNSAPDGAFKSHVLQRRMSGFHGVASFTKIDYHVSANICALTQCEGHNNGCSEHPFVLMVAAPLKHWILVLSGLARTVVDPRVEVREEGMKILSEILFSDAAMLNSTSVWSSILDCCLLPIFYRVVQHGCKHHGPASRTKLKTVASSQPPRGNKGNLVQEWLESTCQQVMDVLVSLFGKHAALVPLLPRMLELIEACVSQENERLAAIAMHCWATLIGDLGPQFSSAQWAAVIECASNLIVNSLPLTLSVSKLRRLFGFGPTSAPIQEYGKHFYKTVAGNAAAAQSFLHSLRPGNHRQGTETHENVKETKDERSADADEDNDGGGFASGTVVAKCKIQIQLLRLSFATFSPYIHSFAPEHLHLLLDSFLTSVQFARMFNLDQNLRKEMQYMGLVLFAGPPLISSPVPSSPTDKSAVLARRSFHVATGSPLPSSVFSHHLHLTQALASAPPELYCQEASGMIFYVKLLFQLYASSTPVLPTATFDVEQRCVNSWREVLVEYTARLRLLECATKKLESFTAGKENAYPTSLSLAFMYEIEMEKLSSSAIEAQLIAAALDSDGSEEGTEQGSPPSVETKTKKTTPTVPEGTKEEVLFCAMDMEVAASCLVPVVCTIIDGWSSLRPEQLRKHIPAFFVLFTGLIGLGHPEVRTRVASLFASRLDSTFGPAVVSSTKDNANTSILASSVFFSSELCQSTRVGKDGVITEFL